MKGNCRNHVLETAQYKGEAILHDYALLQLYGYPGAIVKEGYKVFGELYEVDESLKKQLDYIEGEGYLYKAKHFDVESDGKMLRAGFYEFLQEDGSYKIIEGDKKWKDL